MSYSLERGRREGGHCQQLYILLLIGLGTNEGNDSCKLTRYNVKLLVEWIYNQLGKCFVLIIPSLLRIIIQEKLYWMSSSSSLLDCDKCEFILLINSIPLLAHRCPIYHHPSDGSSSVLSLVPLKYSDLNTKSSKVGVDEEVGKLLLCHFYSSFLPVC